MMLKSTIAVVSAQHIKRMLIRPHHPPEYHIPVSMLLFIHIESGTCKFQPPKRKIVLVNE